MICLRVFVELLPGQLSSEQLRESSTVAASTPAVLSQFTRVPVYTCHNTEIFCQSAYTKHSGEPCERRQCFQELDSLLKTMGRKIGTFAAAPRTSVYTCSAGSVGPHLVADLRRRTNKQEGRRHLERGRAHNSPEAVILQKKRLLIHKKAAFRCHELDGRSKRRKPAGRFHRCA